MANHRNLKNEFIGGAIHQATTFGKRGHLGTANGYDWTTSPQDAVVNGQRVLYPKVMQLVTGAQRIGRLSIVNNGEPAWSYLPRQRSAFSVQQFETSKPCER